LLTINSQQHYRAKNKKQWRSVSQGVTPLMPSPALTAQPTSRGEPRRARDLDGAVGGASAQNAGATQMPQITLQGVRKEFVSGKRRTLAVTDFDLSVDKGSFVSLVGPSGCGKSTVLSMVGGLTHPSSGKLFINGHPVLGPNEHIGTVFQDAHLLPWRTVLSNVLFPVELRKRKVRDYEDRARELLGLAGLSRFADHYPHELSGGMRQRVAICRALILSPEILLMDEPFSALDAMTREEMMHELQRIWSAYGKTVLFVTHSIREAVFLSDRIVVMGLNPGRVIEEVTVDLERPRTAKMETRSRFNEIVDQIRDAIALGHKHTNEARPGDAALPTNPDR
jgi:NitT/TauT family transport system ATP-binding protein